MTGAEVPWPLTSAPCPGACCSPAAWHYPISLSLQAAPRTLGVMTPLVSLKLGQLGTRIDPEVGQFLYFPSMSTKANKSEVICSRLNVGKNSLGRN